MVTGKGRSIAFLVQEVIPNQLCNQFLPLSGRHAPLRQTRAHIAMCAFGAVAPLADLFAGSLRTVFARK